MDGSSKREIEITPDLLEYAKAVALKEAQKRCYLKHVEYDDIVSHVQTHLLRRPPKYDPTKGTKETTFIYTVVKHLVSKYLTKEAKHAERFEQRIEPKPAFKTPEGKISEPRAGTNAARRRMAKLGQVEGEDDGARPGRENVQRHPTEYSTAVWTNDDMFAYIDNEESRALCRLMIECDGNMSEVARRLGWWEGKVRYRLRILGPKLIRAGFNPFPGGDT